MDLTTEIGQRPKFLRRHFPDIMFYLGIAGLAVLVGMLFGDEAIPAATADGILADPNAAQAANEVQAQNLVATWASSPWGAWILAGALTVAAIARRVAPGVWGWAAEVAYNILATMKTRQADHKAYTLAKWSSVAIRTIEAMPDEGTIGELKERVAKTAKSVGGFESMEAALQEEIAHYKTERNSQ